MLKHFSPQQKIVTSYRTWKFGQILRRMKKRNKKRLSGRWAAGRLPAVSRFLYFVWLSCFSSFCEISIPVFWKWRNRDVTYIFAVKFLLISICYWFQTMYEGKKTKTKAENPSFMRNKGQIACLNSSVCVNYWSAAHLWLVLFFSHLASDVFFHLLFWVFSILRL